MSRVAMFSTVYPAALPYVADWYASVRTQTETHFDLWVALDGVTPAELARHAGAPVQAEFRPAASGDSPAELRNGTLLSLLDGGRYDAVILVDCDDVLLPRRVALALRALETCDGCACGMEMVDVDGRSLGMRFGLPAGEWATPMLARENVFGFSNSAYRAALLRSVL